MPSRKYEITVPREFRGTLDSRLAQVAKQLARELDREQRSLSAKSLRLDKEAIAVFSSILVDFAVDEHADVGLWQAYERFNADTFGDPLPLTGGSPSGPFCPERLRHLIWKTYANIYDGMVIDPTHGDIRAMAERASAFLQKRFASLPTADAGVKRLVQSSNEECWEVKRKLVWLGTRSYLFRIPFWHYMAADRHADMESNSDAHVRENRRIDHTDDFICQECTLWSGLGPIDILAAILDIPESQRAEIRRWSERHWALYRIDAVERDHVEAVNLISGVPYTIRHAADYRAFDKSVDGSILGSVVPWKGEWHWSGTQHMIPTTSGPAITDFIREMKRKTSIVCRYCPEQEKAVRDMHEKETRRMLAFHGGDLKLYPDGLSMAADWEREFKAAWKAHPEEEREDIARRHDLPQKRPNMNLPRHLLDNQSGLAVFIHPDEGKEIAIDADAFIRALEKNGDNLDGGEGETVRGWVMSDSISPAFIRRMLSEYGGEESVKAAFRLENVECPCWMEYLLRCHKGHYYRKRYPTLTVLRE